MSLTVLYTLLGILGILLLIVVILLFMPFSYRLFMNTRDRKKVLINAQYMWKVFKAHAEWREEGPFFKQVYIAFQKKFGDDGSYEEVEERKRQEELKQQRREREEELRKKAEEEKLAAMSPLEKVEYKVEVAKEKGEELVEKAKETWEGTEDEPPLKEKLEQRYNSLKDKVTKKDDSEEDASSDEEKKSLKEKLWFLPHVTKQAFLVEVARFLRRVYDHSKPRHFHIEGIYGTGDPAYTAMIAGVLYSTFPEHMDRVGFAYMDLTYKGEGEISGKIIPAFLLWYGLVFILKKPVRPLWMYFIKGGK